MGEGEGFSRVQKFCHSDLLGLRTLDSILGTPKVVPEGFLELTPTWRFMVLINQV